MASDPHDDLLTMYEQFLDARGYPATKIPKTSTRTPDLAVTGHGVTYLNEFKAPDLRLDDKLGLYKFATTNSKLLQFIHTAIKQLQDHDPDHQSPWIVTFASTNLQLHWHSLFESMQGGSVVVWRASIATSFPMSSDAPKMGHRPPSKQASFRPALDVIGVRCEVRHPAE